MAHEIAKLLLEHTASFLERTEAVRSALSLGMALDEIEAYLDWLDALSGGPPPGTSSGHRPAAGPGDATSPPQSK